MRNRTIPRRVRQLNLEREIEADYGKSTTYLEPWQRIGVDPDQEHIITIEHGHARGQKVTCTCGLDRGWQAPIEAIHDARYHREQVAGTRRERHGRQEVALIERKPGPEGWLYRWTCEYCTSNIAAPWHTAEIMAVLASVMHSDACNAVTFEAAEKARRVRHG